MSSVRRKGIAPVLQAKFVHFRNLGPLMVPKGYVGETKLQTFKLLHGRQFGIFDPNITDEKYKDVSVAIVAGMSFRANIFLAVRASSESYLDFLKSHDAFLFGAQGLAILFEQKRRDLPRPYCYTSFDERERLWQSSTGQRMLPQICIRGDGSSDFKLTSFDDARSSIDALVVFSRKGVFS